MKILEQMLYPMFYKGTMLVYLPMVRLEVGRPLQ